MSNSGMAHTPEAPNISEQILEVLRERGKKGLTKGELHQAFGSSQYPYTVVLNLVKSNKACKISDRWYIGPADDWLNVNVFDNIKSDLKDYFLCKDYNPAPALLNAINLEEFEQNAIEGVLWFILYCKYMQLPLPTTGTVVEFMATHDMTVINEEVDKIGKRLS